MTATVPPRLDTLLVGVRSIPAVQSFYEALGWKPRPRNGRFVRFELAGASLVLVPLEQLERAVGLPAHRRNGFGGVAAAMWLDSAEQLDAAVAAVRQAGGTVLAGPADRPWGARTAYIADPEGTVWELAVVLMWG